MDIHEHRYELSVDFVGWLEDRVIGLSALIGSAIASVAWLDGNEHHLRLYYQSTDGSTREHVQNGAVAWGEGNSLLYDWLSWRSSSPGPSNN